MNAACADPNLDVDEDTVLVLRNAGPVGAPGMPEWGNLPIPKKLLALGVRDMLRLSDARMSGTHYGSCVLHICPEAAVGGAAGAGAQRRPDRLGFGRPHADAVCRRDGAGAPPCGLAAAAAPGHPGLHPALPRARDPGPRGL